MYYTMALKYIKQVFENPFLSNTATHCSISFHTIVYHFEIFIYKIHLRLENIIGKACLRGIEICNDK